MTETQKNFCIGEFIISLVLTGLNIFLARNTPEGFIQIICKIFCAICAFCSIILGIHYLLEKIMEKEVSALYEASKTNESCLVFNKSEDYSIMGFISIAVIICLIYFCISGEFTSSKKEGN